jgi:methionine-gamma-lyase
MTIRFFYTGGMDRNRKRFDHESLETRAVHAGRGDLRGLGVHAPPLDLSSTYPIDDLDQATASLDSLAAGGPALGNPIYARLHSPTVARFEEALAELEGTDEAVAFSSGMAALTACLLAASEDGRHAVAIRPLYGGSDHLLAGGLLGIDVTWTTPAGVAAAIRADTSLVILETPANPTLALADVARVVADAGPVPVLVDSTFATPVLQRPAEQGAALVLHSGTKFLGGHGDVVAGVVATGGEWARRLRRVRVATGALLHPLGAYLLHRGLPTLPLRVERAQATARVLAERLAGHPEVERVYYPGLPGGDPEGLIGRQMDGPGALVAFEVSGGYPAARALLEGLRRITPAVSLGSTDTLIQHPAGLTHRVVDEAARRATGITEGLVRISVGLESPDDLWADLDRALAGAAMAAEERLVG